MNRDSAKSLGEAAVSSRSGSTLTEKAGQRKLAHRRLESFLSVVFFFGHCTIVSLPRDGHWGRGSSK
jgi:hypothetical protein